MTDGFDDFTTPAQLIEAAGGFDGFMLEGEISAPIDHLCDDLKELLARSANSGNLTDDEYDESKLFLFRISEQVELLARRLNPSAPENIALNKSHGIDRCSQTPPTKAPTGIQ